MSIFIFIFIFAFIFILGSRSALDRATFDRAFGPFWRSEMLIIRPRSAGEGASRERLGQGALEGRAEVVLEERGG